MYWFIYPVCWFPTFSSKMKRSLLNQGFWQGILFSWV
jgi:hypothetical protein